MPDSRDNFSAICFNLHPPAPAVALLPAPQLMIYRVQGNRNSGGQPGERRHQALSMRFTGCFETEHVEGENFMVPETRRRSKVGKDKLERASV